MQFTEREVLECYTMHMYNSYGFNSSTKTFKLSQISRTDILLSNIFTGIREKLLNPFGYTSGQFTN